MKKAVLSNRIFMNRTKELHDSLEKELSYSIPARVFGQPNEIICDLTRINKDVLTIPIGRTDLVPKDYELVDKRTIIPAIFPKFKFTLREDQEEIYELVNDSCVISANPSWGKTFMGIAITSKLGQKTLVIVHTMHLMHQWISEIQKTLGIEAGIVGDKQFNIDSPITVGTVQSIRNRVLPLKKEFGTVIVDECHHVPATVFKGILDAFSARYKLGLTATPWRKDGKHILLYNYFAGEERVFKAKDQNKLNPTIIIVNTDIELGSNARVPWAKRLNILYDNPRYMELILNLSEIQAKKGHLVLTVADRVEFLRQCHEILEDSMLVVGGVENRDFIGSEKRILLGTGKIYAEGVNIPPLSSLVMGMPINNRSLLEQLLGRISRPHPNKLHPEAIDIALKGKTAKNQLVQRINFYSEQNLKIVKI